MQILRRFDAARWLPGLALAGAIIAAWRLEGGSQKRQRKNSSKSRQAKAVARAGQTVTWRDWKEIGKRVYQAMNDDRLMAVAAGIVFYGLLALFPAITAFVSFYGLFADASTINQHLSMLAGVLPGGAFDIVREQVERILSKGGGELGLAFVFGTSLAVWSANAGMKAMMDALNVVYGVRETRNFFQLNAVSLAFTVGALVALLLAIAAVVVFPLLMSFVGLGGMSDSLMPLLRWPLLFVGLLLALAVLYRFGPSPHGAHWRWITPGSAFASITWILGSALLSWYLANFADYDATYGSLGAAIGLMMWMWMSSIVVLLGSQINTVLDRWNDPQPRHCIPPISEDAKDNA